MKHVDTIVLVDDLNKSREFYTNIMGLEVLHDWDNMIVFKERFSIHTSSALLPKNETHNIFSRGKQGHTNLVIF